MRFGVVFFAGAAAKYRTRVHLSIGCDPFGWPISGLDAGESAYSDLHHGAEGVVAQSALLRKVAADVADGEMNLAVA